MFFICSNLPTPVGGVEHVADLGSEKVWLARGAVSCEREGLFVGGVPLLERRGVAGREPPWRGRPSGDLSDELSACYGLPIDASSKAAGLASVAQALNRGDLALAQMTTLCLQFPDPPSVRLEKSDRAVDDTPALAAQLLWSGLLKADPEWDRKHPRTGTPPDRAWFADVPKAPKTPRAGWPVPKVNKALREWVAELGRFAIRIAPGIDAIVAFLEEFAPTELNKGEQRIIYQLAANFDPPKTLEELQTPPTKHLLGYDLHHIVEQNDANVAIDDDDLAEQLDKFGQAAIDDPDNLVWVPRLKHELITKEYNSLDPNDTEGRLRRQVVNAMNFEEQRAAGLSALRKVGMLK